MSEAKPPVLVFLVDAFRHDFLTEDVTPQACRLADGGRPAPAQADPRLQRRHPGDLLHRPLPRRDRLLDGVLLPAGDEPLARACRASRRSTGCRATWRCAA